MHFVVECHLFAIFKCWFSKDDDEVNDDCYGYAMTAAKMKMSFPCRSSGRYGTAATCCCDLLLLLYLFQFVYSAYDVVFCCYLEYLSFFLVWLTLTSVIRQAYCVVIHSFDCRLVWDYVVYKYMYIVYTVVIYIFT